MTTLYKETQKFNQWWLWIILGAISLIPVVGIYQQLILGNKFGDNPMSDEGLIAFALLMLSFDLMFLLMKLETTITDQYLNVRFFPFVNKQVKWTEVKKAEIIDYGFVGGWGIRLWTQYGTVYNTKGKMGLAITLQNDNKFLIGTQQPEELKKVIQSLSSNN